MCLGNICYPACLRWELLHPECVEPRDRAHLGFRSVLSVAFQFRLKRHQRLRIKPTLTWPGGIRPQTSSSHQASRKIYNQVTKRSGESEHSCFTRQNVHVNQIPPTFITQPLTFVLPCEGLCLFPKGKGLKDMGRDGDIRGGHVLDGDRGADSGRRPYGPHTAASTRLGSTRAGRRRHWGEGGRNACASARMEKERRG